MASIRYGAAKDMITDSFPSIDNDDSDIC